MATIMTKQGNLDNVVTYEHICDTFEDIQSIDPHYITLGSTCVVINGESGGLEVYMADSNKEWQSISITGGESGSGSLPIQILGSNDYDEDGVPTIEFPTENIIYLVPSDNELTNDIFKEWIYVNEDWEQIGGASINIPMPDWNVDTYGSEGYIDNKPAIKSGTANWSIAEGRDTVASSIASHAEGSSTVASGTNSHAEGVDTTASGASAHAEGRHTIAASNYQHVFGEYNIADNNATYVEIVGNGDNNARSNARTLDWNGNEWLAGNLILNQTTLTESKLQDLNDLNIVTMTQAQYNALTNEQKMDGTIRFITDANGENILTKQSIGLGNVDNTADADKPVSTAQQAAIDAVATKVVYLSGTDLIVTAVQNTRYICDELSTLDFTPCATGLCDIRFTSGTSKTILTLPNTVKMPDGFEVEADTIYEINVLDGVYGVVASWPT